MESSKPIGSLAVAMPNQPGADSPYSSLLTQNPQSFSNRQRRYEDPFAAVERLVEARSTALAANTRLVEAQANRLAKEAEQVGNQLSQMREQVDQLAKLRLNPREEEEPTTARRITCRAPSLRLRSMYA